VLAQYGYVRESKRKQPNYLWCAGPEMARLHAYGGDNGTKALSEFDTVDLQALQLARDWGMNGNGHKESRWTYSPCPRTFCGGRGGQQLA
jgi:hypothetical protein